MIGGTGRFSDSSLNRQNSLDLSNSTFDVDQLVLPHSSGDGEGTSLSRRVVSSIDDSIDYGEQQVNGDVSCLNAMVAHLNEISQDFNGCVYFIQELIDADGKSILLDLLERSPLMDDKSGSVHLLCKDAFHVVLFFHLLDLVRKNRFHFFAIKNFFSDMKGQGILDSPLFTEFSKDYFDDKNKQKVMGVTSRDIELFYLNLIFSDDVYGDSFFMNKKFINKIYAPKPGYSGVGGLLLASVKEQTTNLVLSYRNFYIMCLTYMPNMILSYVKSFTRNDQGDDSIE